jgi:hypothetical protein
MPACATLPLSPFLTAGVDMLPEYLLICSICLEEVHDTDEHDAWHEVLSLLDA